MKIPRVTLMGEPFWRVGGGFPKLRVGIFPNQSLSDGRNFPKELLDFSGKPVEFLRQRHPHGWSNDDNA